MMTLKAKIKKDAAAVAKELLACQGIVYTFGNGGSASIADHMACDWMKGSNGRVKVLSLSSNGPLLSAIGNDLGFEDTCSAQINWLSTGQDILVLVSSSGVSPNVVKAALCCCLRVICFTGEAGNRKCETPIKELADVSVHCKSKDYGVIEDYHSQVMHEVVRILKKGTR